jgi:hypothetical protein
MLMQQYQLMMADATRASIAQCDTSIDTVDDVLERMEAIQDWDTCHSLMNVKTDLLQVRQMLQQRLLRIAH